MKKRIIALLLAVCLCATLLTACGKKTSGDNANSGVLQMAWNADMGTDTIFESPYIEHSYWAAMLYDTPLNINADGTTVYKLASDVQVSDDGLTYTFTMRDDAKWTDGEPVTAEDLAFSLWAIIADPKSNYSTGFMYIEGADAAKQGTDSLSGVAVDGNTVTVTLTAPYSLFLNTVAANLFVLPAHCFDGVKAEDMSTYEDYWKAPVGNGAYKMDEISFPDYFTMVRNDGYYRDAAGIEKVLYTSYATGGDDAMVAALISGTLDFAAGGSINDQSTADNIASQNGDITVLTMTGNYLRQFLFNINGPDAKLGDGNGHPSISDVRVRKAINMLLDKEAVAGFYGEQAMALTTLVNPANPSYNSDIPAFQRDVEGAKKLLEEANFDFDHVLRVGYHYTDQTTADIMQLIKQNLEEAGIKVELCLQSGDLGTLIYDVRNYDIYYSGENMDSYVELYNVELSVNGYFDKLFGNEDERQTLFNDVVSKYFAASADDTATQAALLNQLQQNNYDAMYIAPVYGLNTLVIYNTKHVQVPTDLYQVACTSQDMRWEDWKLVG